MFSKRIIRSIPKFRIIKNIEYPACERCSNFIPIFETSYSPEHSKNGLCIKFGEKNMITGKIKYDYAIDCRNDASKCTKYARYFTPLNPHPLFIEN